MTSAADYLAYVKSLIVLCDQVVSWHIVREEAQGDRGLWRYRLQFRDGSLLEMFEFFVLESATVKVMKYSFHWQDADGKLLKRWDNAPHHPEISTYPHHLHDGAEDIVIPHAAVSCGDILGLLSASMNISE